MNGINWGSVADWAAAAGSVFAAGVALYLATASQRVSMSVICGYRVMVGGGGEPSHLASILVTNTGGRPFKISSVSIRHGVLRKHHGIIKLGEQLAFCDRLLIQLNDGDTSHFGVDINSNTNWVAHMKNDCKSWLDVASIRITIHCTNGQKSTIKPERPLLKMIFEGVKMKAVDRNGQT